MQSERAQAGEVGCRLHPTSLFFSIGAAARRMLLPLIVVFFAPRGDYTPYLVSLFFVPVVVGSLIRYWNYLYRLEGDELIVRDGLVTRNERHVPYARIQNIDLVQNPLHRMFGVAEVRVETAGGEKPEVVMRVLSLDAVERMRALVFVGRSREEVPTEAAPARDLVRMTLRDIVLFGVISNRGMVVVAALAGLIWQFDVWERFGEFGEAVRVDRLKELTDGTSLLSGVLLGIAGVATLVVLMRILSIGWAILQFSGFRLERRGDDLRVEQGLVTRVFKTIPRHRIQLLSKRDGPLHRWAGLTSIRAETAGGSSEEHGPSGGRSLWLAPLIREERVAGLLREVLPEVPFDAPDWQPICRRAWLRIFRPPLVVLLPISIAGWFAIGAWILVPVSLLGILAYLNARLYVRHAAYALLPGAIAYRRGWWARRTNIVRFEKIQSVERAESPFDRRHGMASVHVDTAGGGAPGGHSIDASYLEAAVATELSATLGDAAARTAFRW